MNRLIEIIVSPDGQTRVETKGFKGAECQQASRFLRQALGKQTDELLTQEFFQFLSTEQKRCRRLLDCPILPKHEPPREDSTRRTRKHRVKEYQPTELPRDSGLGICCHAEITDAMASLRRWQATGGSERFQSLSRRKHRMRGVWQKRFWEHTVMKTT